MENEIKKMANKEIREFNKTITKTTTNKEIWNKRVELCKKYGLKVIGKFTAEKVNKYVKLSTIKKGEDTIYIVVEPKAIDI